MKTTPCHHPLLRRAHLALALFSSLCAVVNVTRGQVSLTGTAPSYTQSFNSLPVPATNGDALFWSNNNTLSGWFRATSGTLTGTPPAGDWSGNGTVRTSNTPSLFNWGVTGVSSIGDRALGMRVTTSNAGSFGVAFKNDTTVALQSVAVTYNGEQWRKSGAASATRLDLQYIVLSSFNAATFDIEAQAGWIDAPSSLDFVSPNTTTGVGGLDGNSAANRATPSGTIAFATPVPAGSYLVLRWHYATPSVSGHGLAIDNVNLSFSSEPVGFTLAFSDEFSGSSVDTAKWNYRTGAGGESYQRAENVSVANGNLVIALEKEDFGGKSYTGGGVITKQGLEYGWYEARMKLSVGNGWHPSFWTSVWDGLYPQPNFSTTPRIEIDINEFDIGRWSTAANNLYRWYPFYDGYKMKTSLPSDLATAYHTWACEYTPDYIKYYKDGLLTNTTYGPLVSPHNLQHLYLSCIKHNLVLTSQAGTMLVDYFRYYTKDGGYFAPLGDSPLDVEYLGYTSNVTVTRLAEDMARKVGALSVSSAQVGDYISFTVPVNATGTYPVRIMAKKFTSARGTFQLSINGVNQGTPFDLNGTTGYVLFDCGNASFPATGNYTFKLTAVSTTSSGYAGIFDYIDIGP